MASSVSHFKHGSDYESINYSDVEVFHGNLLTEKVQKLSLIRDNGHIVGAEHINPFKPDFTMTNAGLHKQLPTDEVPVVWLDNTASSSSSGLRLAILACKWKRKDGLIAIYLRKDENSAFLRYSRVMFDGGLIQHLEEAFYKKPRILSITNFNSIWIPKAAAVEQPLNQHRLASTAKRVRFESWYKGPRVLTEIKSSYESGATKQRLRCEEAANALQTLGDQVTKEYREAEEDLRHYISGSFPTTGFKHELVALHDDVAKSTNSFAFGIIDGYIWVICPRPADSFDYQTCYSRFNYPNGGVWREPEVPIGISPNDSGWFWINTRPGRLCSGQFVTHTGNLEEVSFRIYVSSKPGEGEERPPKVHERPKRWYS